MSEMDELELELKKDFLEESTQLLNDAEQAFLDLEGSLSDPSLLDQIFRLAHNLKGTSRAVGFGEIAEFTHEMENLILNIKEGLIKINPDIVSVLLECNDHLVYMICGLKADIHVSFDSSDIITKVKNALSGGPLTTDDAKNEKHTDEHDIDQEDQFQEDQLAETSNLDSFTAADVQTLIALEEKENVSSEDTIPDDSISSDSNSSGEESQLIPLPVRSKSEATSREVAADESIRVSLSRVDDLINFAGELVILQTVLAQHSTEVQSTLMLKSMDQLGKLAKEIQEMSMSLRMVPLKQTLQKMQRIVRDTSKELGKKVHLQVFGDETEVDKTVLQHLSDPLVHIVRNAVDHGLENTEERLQSNKDEYGTVKIRAYHEGNNLVIRVSDDGRGVDPEVIRKKAIEKGILSASANVSSSELIQFLFHPGFSTKDQVSEISGRGVGMDVVKSNIQQLSGNVTMESTVGKGSIVTIYLPLTLAIVEGVIVSIGEEKYVIPQTQVFETIRPRSSDIEMITSSDEVINVRGETLPLFRLCNILKRKCKLKPFDDSTAIIVKSKSTKFAVIVDDILHKQQVVIKQLGYEIKDRNGFVGTSVLGDGMPAIIVDLQELLENKIAKAIVKPRQQMSV